MLAVSTGRNMAATDTILMGASFLASLLLGFCHVASAFRVYEGPNTLDDVLSKRDVGIPLIINVPSLVNNPGYDSGDAVSRPSAMGQIPTELDYVDFDAPDYVYGDEFGLSEPVPVSSSGLDEALAAYYRPLQQKGDEEEDEGDSSLSVAKRDGDGGTEAMLLPSRRKRYTEFQEAALGICAGSCMYLERMTYGDCYDLCDWNGRTPSPWKKYEQQKMERQLEAQRAAVTNVKSNSLPANDPARVLSHRFGQRKGPRTAALTASPTSTGSQGRRGKIKLKVERPPSRTSSEVQKLEAVAAALVQGQGVNGKKPASRSRKKISTVANSINPSSSSGCRS